MVSVGCERERMADPEHSLEEQVAASVVASLGAKGWKRPNGGNAGDSNGLKPAKLPKIDNAADNVPATTVFGDSVLKDERVKYSEKIRKEAPFFYYRDHSMDPDDDPLTPLTPPGRVPNFPAKMHAILSRPDLVDVVSWMPHGRSWRVLKPREFEIRVIPTYFEHSKFSSFIRQANGWGFRRITQGRDRNSYYNELFLRGLPHLCKQMKRPGVSEKATADAEHEPDLYKISEQAPVPEKHSFDDDSIMLPCTIVGGPKARMPVYTRPRVLSTSTQAPSWATQIDRTFAGRVTNPRDVNALPAFYRAPAVSGNQQLLFGGKREEMMLPSNSIGSNQALSTLGPDRNSAPINLSNMDCLAAADRLAYSVTQTGAAQAVANAQFAAGFVAGSALSSSHIRNVLGQAMVGSSQPFVSHTMPSPTGFNFSAQENQQGPRKRFR